MTQNKVCTLCYEWYPHYVYTWWPEDWKICLPCVHRLVGDYLVKNILTTPELNTILNDDHITVASKLKPYQHIIYNRLDRNHPIFTALWPSYFDSEVLFAYTLCELQRRYGSPLKNSYLLIKLEDMTDILEGTCDISPGNPSDREKFFHGIS